MFKSFFPLTLWRLPLRVRVLLATLLYKKNRYSYKSIVNNIFNSDEVRKIELASAKPVKNRIQLLSICANIANSLPGDVLEFGVYKGESLHALSLTLSKDKSIFGFDSFLGLPENWGEILPKGYFHTKVPKFEAKNINLIVGLFEDTLHNFLVKNQNLFSLVHIDCDLYLPTVFILENIIDRMIPGGIIVFDEYYGYPDFENFEYLAWKECSKKSNRKFKPIFYSSHSCAFIALD